jgi:hypothetical protein
VSIAKGLQRRDPLSERVHHGKAAFAALALAAAASEIVRRTFGRRAATGISAGARGR